MTVVTPDGTSPDFSGDQLTYTAEPLVEDINSTFETSGPVGGGTTVTLGGFNLSDAAVNFGGTLAASFTVNSDGSITAVSPAGGPGVVAVSNYPEGTLHRQRRRWKCVRLYSAPKHLGGRAKHTAAWRRQHRRYSRRRNGQRLGG